MTEGLIKLIKSDLARYSETYRLRGQKYSRHKIFWESLLFKPGFQAVLLYRLSHWLHQKKLLYGAWFIARLNQFLTGAEIEFNSSIGPGMFIAHPSGIVIGRGTRIGSDVTIFQNVSFAVRDWHPDNIKRFPEVGNGCFFFAGATMLGEIVIGDNCVVSAKTVVTRDMAAGSLARGLPGEIIPCRGADIISSWRPGSGLEKQGQER